MAGAGLSDRLIEGTRSLMSFKNAGSPGTSVSTTQGL
jgi:hypothetical protein